MQGIWIHFVACLPLIGLVVFGACRRTADVVDAGTVSLIVSGDTAGWIMPCGCSANQAGGLARRATYIKSLSGSSNVIVADVGGAPSGIAPYDLAKFAAILRGEV